MQWNAQYRLKDAIDTLHPNLCKSKALHMNEPGFSKSFTGSWLEDRYVGWIRSVGDDICFRHRRPGLVICRHGERFSWGRLTRVSKLTTADVAIVDGRASIPPFNDIDNAGHPVQVFYDLCKDIFGSGVTPANQHFMHCLLQILAVDRHPNPNPDFSRPLPLCLNEQIDMLSALLLHPSLNSPLGNFEFLENSVRCFLEGGINLPWPVPFWKNDYYSSRGGSYFDILGTIRDNPVLVSVYYYGYQQPTNAQQPNAQQPPKPYQDTYVGVLQFIINVHKHINQYLPLNARLTYYQKELLVEHYFPGEMRSWWYFMWISELIGDTGLVLRSRSDL